MCVAGYMFAIRNVYTRCVISVRTTRHVTTPTDDVVKFDWNKKKSSRGFRPKEIFVRRQERKTRSRSYAVSATVNTTSAIIVLHDTSDYQKRTVSVKNRSSKSSRVLNERKTRSGIGTGSGPREIYLNERKLSRMQHSRRLTKSVLIMILLSIKKYIFFSNRFPNLLIPSRHRSGTFSVRRHRRLATMVVWNIISFRTLDAVARRAVRPGTFMRSDGSRGGQADILAPGADYLGPHRN